MLSLIASLWTLALWRDYPFSQQFILFNRKFFLLIFPWLFIAIISDSYSIERICHMYDSLKNAGRTAIELCILYSIFYFVSFPPYLPRLVVILFAIVAFIFITIWRVVYFRLFYDSYSQQIAIIGSLKEVEQIETSPVFCNLYKIVKLSSIEELSGCKVDKLILAGDQMDSISLATILKVRELGISIIPISLFYERLYRKVLLADANQNYCSYTLPLEDNTQNACYSVLKRTIDIILSLIGLALFACIFPLLAAAIRLSSPGPVFFSQVRVGWYGKKFRLWKLRTMVTNAEDKGPMWTEHRDARVTGVGRILRKLHLDEFPQLWNVLNGEMTIVGVRPLSVAENQKIALAMPLHNLRHLVKPSLTSWAVVNHKHVNNFEDASVRLEYDLYYVKHQSFALDILIILRTIWSIGTLNTL